jgi:NAD(P)-dependent dehydrogenase (short-subunit alcohol dehydrogenase family)
MKQRSKEALKMEQRFAGKVAIVTGAGQGIGRGIALRLAREGADLVIAEYNPDTAGDAARTIEALGRQALAYPVDISNTAAVKQMVEDVVARFGRIDILVNNAGVVQTKPMMDLTEEDWDRIVNVNQRGLFFCLQAVAAQMIRQLPEGLRVQTPSDVVSMKKTEPGSESFADQDSYAGSYGKIVNFSSIAGRRGRPLSTHYAATKAAVISVTQSAALALAPYRINVNAVCPGLVPTPMWKQIDEERGQLFGAEPGEAMAAFIQTIPLKRAAVPEDIAGTVAFFCSADADYITGQALNVDGGYEMD